DENMDISGESATPVDGDRPMSDVEETTTLAVTDYDAFASKIMPDPGYEIEDFQHHTWHISNWRGLEKRITGPEFETGGWKWRILLFPQGNNNTDTVSIYLDFADPKGAPAGWHSCVQFALVLWNPHEPTQYISHNAHHRFTAEESDWGFTRFFDLRKLFSPSENRTRPLIENDSCNITAFVRVLKDPTGVLWHNFIKYFTSFLYIIRALIRKYSLLLWPSIFLALCLTSSCSYDSKKETGYAVYQIPTEDDEPSKSISLALQRVFYQLQTSDTPVGTTELTRSFGWDSLDSFMQHDVQEFNRVLQDNLEGKMKNTNADGAITRLFVGKMKSYVKCVNVDYESSRVEDYYDIQLNVKGCKNLDDSFMEYIQEETLEGENKYQAEGYGLQDAKKGVIFENFPPVLHLQLKRFEYDMQRDTTVKINDRYEFPMEIDLERYLSPEADKAKPYKYLLHGVLVHSGDLHGGHYFALLKPEKNGKWLKFDDDRITPVTDKEVLEDNFGGEDSNVRLSPAIRTGGRNLKRFTNAYMLVYIRECDIDDILSPVQPQDIPEHLQRRLDEERALYEQRKKEAEERHLYLSTKIVTPDTFSRHQGFDLANFDDRQYPISEVPQFKVLKSETYGNFKHMAAKQFGYPAEQIRFWVLVNRQNKTVRPDTPITDNFLAMTMEEIHTKMAARQNELKLFLEVADKPINGKVMLNVVPATRRKFPHHGFPQILQPRYAISRFGKVGEIIPILCEKKEFPSHTPLKIYEEIKPNMIEEMKPKLTFQQSEIQDGDIICFQKALTDKEIHEHNTAGRIREIPAFYESLSMRIVVQFKPKYKDREQKPEFELVLNKKHTYDDVSKRVAAHLSTDPLKLRFTTAHPTTGHTKNVIKRSTNQTLQEILQTSYPPNSANLLYYEMLDISIVELETKKFFKVFWLGKTIKEEEVIDVRLPKTAIINEILEAILQKLSLSVPTSRIRLYEVLHCKIHKEYDYNDPIDKIQEQPTLYAEEIPQEELEKSSNEKVVQVYHFTKEPIRSHGVPFRFVIKADEPFSATKLRLQSRLGMNEKDFSKVKVAIVQALSYAKPQYIEDDNFVLSDHKWTDELLGLDHVDKTGRAGRVGGEKAIYIRG
ncbi:19364_t:CDS:10, partial [Gigaspora margarita]